MKVERALAVPDLHIPFHNRKAWKGILAAIRREKPHHLVVIGDALDVPNVSRFPKTGRSNLVEEATVMWDLLHQARRASKSVRRAIYLMGNHEQRLFRPDLVDESLHSLTDKLFDQSLFPEAAWWLVKPYELTRRGVYRVGNVWFSHGHAVGLSGDETEALELSRIMERGGKLDNQLSVRGHTHRPCPPTQCRKGIGNPLPLWYANVGWAGDLGKVDYALNVKTSRWGCAPLLVTVRNGRWVPGETRILEV